MEKVINKLINFPLLPKVGVVALLVVIMSSVNYFVFVTEIREQVIREERTLEEERKKLIERQAIANDINRYRREMEDLQRALDEALTEMPAQARLDELIIQLSELAQEAGLLLNNITPQPETKDGAFYYRIPISMQVTGSYHEVAIFLDLLSRMQRIMNVTNINLSSPRVQQERVILSASYLASTFRFAGD